MRNKTAGKRQKQEIYISKLHSSYLKMSSIFTSLGKYVNVHNVLEERKH